MKTTIRPLTRQEAIPRVIEASAEVRGLARAYEAAIEAETMARCVHSACSHEYDAAGRATDRARKALEDLLCRLALADGRAWHRVGDCEWGLKQGRGSGFELARRVANMKGPRE